MIFVINIINDDHQAFATYMATATSNEKTIVHQGLIASTPSTQVKPERYEHLQTVVILPFRIDGSIYKGTLTFTATKPVDSFTIRDTAIWKTISTQLRTNGEPFIAAYEVAADIVKPTIIEHLENATTTITVHPKVR